MTISPVTHSLVSLTKKSALEAPIPIAQMVTGTPLYNPVIVKKPRSDSSKNGVGFGDSSEAMFLAREGGPTVIWRNYKSFSMPLCFMHLLFDWLLHQHGLPSDKLSHRRFLENLQMLSHEKENSTSTCISETYWHLLMYLSLTTDLNFTDLRALNVPVPSRTGLAIKLAFWR